MEGEGGGAGQKVNIRGQRSHKGHLQKEHIFLCTGGSVGV